MSDKEQVPSGKQSVKSQKFGSTRLHAEETGRNCKKLKRFFHLPAENLSGFGS